jgi:protocatechuate 3,4-dioxygenase beta subunit
MPNVAAAPLAPIVRLHRPTEHNILGPFYRDNAPFRTQLAETSEPGEALSVRGRVVGVDGRPLRRATVDVWHANGDGHYDNDGAHRQPAPDHFHLRGRMVTDANGSYAFETVLPGTYEDEPGIMRPRHIHYIVSCPGYATLTTQLYFAGDPWLAIDPYALPSLVIELERRGAGLAGTFDVVLAKA